MRLAVFAFAALLALGCNLLPRIGHPGAATPTPQTPAGALTHDDLQSAINAVQGDPDSFGGLWWDQTGWPLHVAIKSTDPAMRAKVEQWLPAGAPLEWHHVRFSYAELNHIQDEFVSWWNADPAAHGSLEVNSTSVDVVRNVVTFSLVRHDAAFESDLKSRYGDAVEFVIEPAAEPL